MAANYNDIYDKALEKEIIEPIPNDILNAHRMVTLNWISEPDYENANDGTHQVIAKDAVERVSQIFPGFFELKDDVSIVQLYSDYPDIKEKGLLFNGHFYHYPTKTNYLDIKLDTTTAKDNFYRHYNKAISYYSTDRTKAFQELGMAMHYLSDMGTPVHTVMDLEV